MARVVISEVSVARDFEVHHYTGCDGYPAAKVIPVVFVVAEDGREFYLPAGERRYDAEEGVTWVAARYDAAELEGKVRARGSIDAALWVELEAPASLEDRWADEAYREAEDRYAATGSYFG
jgi:hypothetical protein